MNVIQQGGTAWNIELTPSGSSLVMFAEDEVYEPPPAPFNHAHLLAHRRKASGCPAFRPVIMVHIIGGRFVHIFYATSWFEGVCIDDVLEQVHAALLSLDDEFQLGIGNCMWSAPWKNTKTISPNLGLQAVPGSLSPVLIPLD